jgi:RNA polymerase sigma factor (sigma-70 family)
VKTNPPFEQVVSHHGATVLRVCRALLSSADADDAWSDTFLAALEAYPRLPADANIEAWLVTIAHRKAIDILRRVGRQAVPVADVAGLRNDQAAPMRDLDLTDILASLPDKQRLVVVYHYLAGLPYAEVATLVGGSEAAARRAAADGIANLRKAQGLN